MWRCARTFAVLLLVLSAAPAGAADSPIGQIKKTSGAASVIRGSEHLAAKAGLPIYQGDVIETGPDGGVGVTLRDNSVFSAGPSTQLAVPEFKYDAGKGSMLAELRKGTLTVVSGEITHNTPGAMSIRTPTALLGVRGTTFAVEVVIVGLCQCINDHSAMRMRCLPNARSCQRTCGSTVYSFVPASRTDIAACPPQEQYPQERYVVLPNADGRPGAGAITVTYGGTATTLDQPYAAEQVRDGKSEALSLKPAEAQDLFQDALAARPALPWHFRLYFNAASDRMTPESTQAYRTLLAEIKTRPVYEVELVGHADRPADAAHNKRLSLDRAVAVKRALIRDGVDGEWVSVAGRGESEPLIRAPRGTAEPRNRRVEILVR